MLLAQATESELLLHDSRIPGAGLILARRQSFHVIAAQLKVVDVCVLLDTAGCDRFG